MPTRKPVVAGQFYPGDRDECLAQVRACLEGANEYLAGPAGSAASVPATIVGALVPHAGWTFSGTLAALAFRAIRDSAVSVETFVLCGTAHGYYGAEPADDDSDLWECPLGDVAVDRALRERLVDRGVVRLDRAAHRREHSIEVQVPFVAHLFPQAKILPLTVPPTRAALALGDALAEVMAARPGSIVCVGSTDLTHYGPRYGFTPMGAGADGLRWASEVNDRAFIDLAVTLEAERLLARAIENGNACGPGAAAAVVGAARGLGVQRGCLLAHTTSNEVMLRTMGVASRDSVGYAAIVF
ncbi:MAG TPA: AmmeMemoRadiSam system protein B [Sedimentisphaerales bacterium]|nr:AmmeMemoRadiSam system protein B [Sedimentisphaerales bacterium]HRS13267.1 AmmeMemoRadiSam system protein B [Sedimentisphaerales bacterium]HRV49874.1 AmmeMemoRadiSam system protein B [Sedimentisphaerales bacterium]